MIRKCTAVIALVALCGAAPASYLRRAAKDESTMKASSRINLEKEGLGIESSVEPGDQKGVEAWFDDWFCPMRVC